MKTTEDVAEMLRLQACGWRRKRIARHLGCSHHTVKTYLDAGGVVAFKAPARAKALAGLDDWLRDRFIRHRGNAACVRFETLPGHQLQIDFGERLVEIAGERVKAFLFVATLGYSRRCHVLAFCSERQESWLTGERVRDVRRRAGGGADRQPARAGHVARRGDER